jgi:diguanylate cyclase (GGDEF)-like protein
MDIANSLVFDLSPIPMWIEDFSDVKIQLEQWRAQGVQDLAAFLHADLSRALNCARKIKFLHVNTRTLELFQARDLEDLQNNINCVFCDEFAPIHVQQLIQLWNGHLFFAGDAINYSLTGHRIDLRVRGHVLTQYQDDWSQVLITTEDITPYKAVARREIESRIMAETLFMRSPAALLMQNFSYIKQQLHQLRLQGIDNFPEYLDQNPEFVQDCLQHIVVEDVNQSALELFANHDKVALIADFPQTLIHAQMHETFHYQLMMLWENILTHQREAAFMAFDGNIRYVYLQFTVFPGHEDDWSKIQIALTDITARKEAETYLEFLSQHDVLTDVYNRAFYTAEVERLEKENIELSCIYIDINSLKPINDQLGHAAGDQLLKRTGEILKRSLVLTEHSISRIGGDEFVILMPYANTHVLRKSVNRIKRLLRLNNMQHSSLPLSLSMGYTHRLTHECISETLHRADQRMYENKQAYYSRHERRQTRNISYLKQV